MSDKIKETPKPCLNQTEWFERKETLKNFVSKKVNEIGIDNDLCIPDYAIAEAMVESINCLKVAFRLGVQSVKGRGLLEKEYGD